MSNLTSERINIFGSLGFCGSQYVFGEGKLFGTELDSFELLRHLQNFRFDFIEGLEQRDLFLLQKLGLT